jgi:hypothetical protein
MCLRLLSPEFLAVERFNRYLTLSYSLQPQLHFPNVFCLIHHFSFEEKGARPLTKIPYHTIELPSTFTTSELRNFTTSQTQPLFFGDTGSTSLQSPSTGTLKVIRSSN